MELLTEDMKKEIVNRVANMIYGGFRESRLLDETMNAVKEKVAADLASDVAGRFHKRVNVDQVVEKAIVGFEERINSRIAKTLEKGIVVKLAP